MRARTHAKSLSHVRQGLITAVAHGDAGLAQAAARVALAGDETDLLARAGETLENLVDARPFW